MAEYLDTNISPDDVTIDNIGSYDKTTENVLNEIQFTDKVKYERDIIGCQNHMNRLPQIKRSKLEIKHLRGSLADRDNITTPVNGSIFFIRQS